MTLTNWLAEARNSLTYHTEGAILEFTDELIRLMDEQNMSRADLAAAIGSSPAYITKVLGGNANFTLATMTKLARALDATVHVQLTPETPIRLETTRSQKFYITLDADQICAQSVTSASAPTIQTAHG